MSEKKDFNLLDWYIKNLWTIKLIIFDSVLMIYVLVGILNKFFTIFK